MAVGASDCLVLSWLDEVADFLIGLIRYRI